MHAIDVIHAKYNSIKKEILKIGDTIDQKEFYALMYNTVTPYYQIISVIFLICGISCIIASFFVIEYIIPGIVSLFFGVILALFLKKMKIEAKR